MTTDARRSPTDPPPLRHAVIGVGAGVLHMHRTAFELESVQLVAASDVDVVRGRARAEELGCAFYADHRTMLREVAPDVAVVLTPHPYHAPVAIDCLEAGCHVLVEKPMATDVADADAMVEAAAGTDRLLAVNFQNRFRPDVRAVRHVLQEGRLGRLQYVDMTMSWPRTGCYYRNAPWRGTWAGEGGGVLLNQAPHNLDLLCHLLGLPRRVVAWTRTTLHAIETEDTVQAMLEWDGGTMGSVHISTAEAHRPERLEIVGTGGSIRMTDGAASLTTNDLDFRAMIASSDHPFGTPATTVEQLELGPDLGGHLAVYRNLHDAIRGVGPLLVDGASGSHSLELANAMTFSSRRRTEVELPLDRAAYTALLRDLIEQAAAAPVQAHAHGAA